MFDKFNVYDLLGYLLPGATVVLTLYWIATWGFAVPLPELKDDFGATFFFVGLSYVVGQLIHGIGSIYEQAINKPYEGLRLSERLIADETYPDIKQPFTPELKARIFSAARDVFMVAEKKAEVFEQCYAAIVQQGLAQHTEIFLALNGLARSMMVASWIGLIASAALAMKQIALQELVYSGVTLPVGLAWIGSKEQTFVGLIAMGGFLLALLLMHRAFHRFRMYFATSVYYNFLAWYSRQQM